MSTVKEYPPSGYQVVEYDRCNLALYAALIEAEDEGRDWQEAASSVLNLDVNRHDAEACWRSHLDRARWIIGEGL